MNNPPSTIRLTASSDGFTIIEVLIALAIFSIGIMAMGALQSTSLLATRNIAEKTEAWTALEDQSEWLKSLPFFPDGIDNDGDGNIDEPDEAMADLLAGNHAAATQDGRYTVTWQVVDNAATVANSKTVTVRVTRQGENPLTEALAMVQFVRVPLLRP